VEKLRGNQECQKLRLNLYSNIKNKRVVAEIPKANSKEFLVTILSEAKRPQRHCLIPQDEFWVCSEVKLPDQRSGSFTQGCFSNERPSDILCPP
jgi:hypothetical protein